MLTCHASTPLTWVCVGGGGWWMGGWVRERERETGEQAAVEARTERTADRPGR